MIFTLEIDPIISCLPLFDNIGNEAWKDRRDLV